MNTKFLKNLGLSLKNIRKQRGYTQENIAEIVNIHPTYVGKIESGKANLSTMMLYKISKALKVNLPEIFSFDK